MRRSAAPPGVRGRPSREALSGALPRDAEVGRAARRPRPAVARGSLRCAPARCGGRPRRQASAAAPRGALVNGGTSAGLAAAFPLDSPGRPPTLVASDDGVRAAPSEECTVPDPQRSAKEARMPHYLSEEELKRTAPAELASFRSPIPTQIVSNGEFNPLPQTRDQQRVEARIGELADDLGPRHGLNRRQFLASTAGMAAAFLAMNEVFGAVFDVTRAEAQTPGTADQRAKALAGQFIIDDQTHFVRADFNQAGLLDLAKYARQNWNPALVGDSLARYKFENYVKEIFVDSDTKVALLSGAPFDDPTWDLLSNDQ